MSHTQSYRKKPRYEVREQPNNYVCVCALNLAKKFQSNSKRPITDSVNAIEEEFIEQIKEIKE